MYAVCILPLLLWILSLPPKRLPSTLSLLFFFFVWNVMDVEPNNASETASELCEAFTFVSSRHV